MQKSIKTKCIGCNEKRFFIFKRVLLQSIDEGNHSGKWFFHSIGCDFTVGAALAAIHHSYAPALRNAGALLDEFPRRNATAIKLRHGLICGGDFSRPASKQPTAQSATKVAPTSAIILSNPLSLMAVTRERENYAKATSKI